jgi:hypothetical protein
LLALIPSLQFAEGHTPVKQTRPNGDPRAERLLASYDHPLYKTTLKIDLQVIRTDNAMPLRLEGKLLAATEN